MFGTPRLHHGYEHLIGAAAVDGTLRAKLLRDPAGTAQAFGLCAADASLVADIRASDLQSFAVQLRPRLYGLAAPHALE